MKNLKNLAKKLIIILAIFILLFSSSFTTIYAVEEAVEEAISENTEEETGEVTEESTDGNNDTEEQASIEYTPNEDYTKIQVDISMETKQIVSIYVSNENYDSELLEEDYTFEDDTSSWTFSEDNLLISKVYEVNIDKAYLLYFEDETKELIEICISSLEEENIADESNDNTSTESDIATVSTEESSISSSEDDGIATVSEDDIATVANATSYSTITDTTLLNTSFNDVQMNVTSLPTIKNLSGSYTSYSNSTKTVANRHHFK